MLIWEQVRSSWEYVRSSSDYCTMLLNTGQNINPLGHSMSDQPVMEHMSGPSQLRIHAPPGVNILFVFAHIWDGKILKVLHGSVEGYSNFNITLMYKS